MNAKQFLEFLKTTNLDELTKDFEIFLEKLKYETCKVCITCEEDGCVRYDEKDMLKKHPIPCEIGEFLGEMSY